MSRLYDTVNAWRLATRLAVLALRERAGGRPEGLGVRAVSAGPDSVEIMILDSAQRAVVELPLDASGVVAGAPGSGKTAAVIARVVHLVQAGVSPDEVLVLTPSRAAATALRDRLALAVERATAGALARSVAAFAYRVVRAHAVHAGEQPPQLLTGPDEDHLIAELLEGDAADEAEGLRRWPEWLDPDARRTRGFRGEMRAFLAECTTLGISPDQLATLGRAHGVEVWEAAASFAREYQWVRERMRGAHRDAAGLLREAAVLLRTAPDGAAALRALGGLRAIVVDDAQELTRGGIELLEECRARGVAVLAFGDPDVGSGTFRGATPENFARLASASPVYILRGGYRGTSAQRDLVSAVTSQIGAVGLVAHRRGVVAPSAGAERADGNDGSVRAVFARSAAEELDLIARTLRERHVHDAVPWGECAVIAHDTRQVAALEAELAAREVPTRASGQGQPLADVPVVRALLERVLRATQPIADWTGDDVVDTLYGAGLDAMEVRRLRTALRHGALANSGEGSDRTGAQLLASGLAHPIEFALVDTREGRRAEKVARSVGRLHELWTTGATAHELLWEAWDGIDGDRVWGSAAAGNGPTAAQANRELDALVELFSAAKRHGEREDGTSSLAFLRGVLESDVAEDRLQQSVDRDRVQILTPASALGTEFDTVIVAGVQEGVWPNLRTRSSLLETWRLASLDMADTLDRARALLHDELRLFVRASSRARRLLLVTAVNDDDATPSPFFEMLPDAETAAPAHPLTLRGLVARHRRTLTEGHAPQGELDHAAEQLALLAEAGVPGAAPEEWFGVLPLSSSAPLHDLSQADVRVSPSRIKALEECELNWVISDLGADAGGTTAGVGTIVHAAMEHATGASEEELWAVVEQRWGELEFESPWRERAELARTRDLIRRLSVYLRRFAASGSTLVGAEPHFDVPLTFDSLPAPSAPAADGDEAHRVILSGDIDRVERTPEGDVVIVDLKTGKNEPQTDAKVADNPQLAAYQLALHAGAIPEAAGLTPGGAKLLVLRPSATRKDYVEPRQPPADEQAREQFLDRIETAVTVMCGTSFVAPVDDHCRNDYSFGQCRIHTIGAVSAS